MKSLTNPLGLYLHIPFCNSKCAYCDFYSVFPREELIDSYTQALIRELKQWGGYLNRPIDTIYLGGGTPSLLNHRLPTVINEVKKNFTVAKNAEITLEMNPTGNFCEILENARAAGINRLSIGAQSGNDDELSALGRKHTAQDTVNTVKRARDLGFNNISLDLMLGLPNSDTNSLERSLEFICDLQPNHISAYILKIEPKTVFYKKQNILNIPDDDLVAQQYLQMCSFFKEGGYRHYEISNFSRNGFQSKHNLKYWDLEDYLGIGPAAHSFIENKRFYFPRDIKSFINNPTPLQDGQGGDKEEFIMLKLRTDRGINFADAEKLNITFSDAFFKKVEIFQKAELLVKTDKNIHLTDKGMLLSNSIITELLECIK